MITVDVAAESWRSTLHATPMRPLLIVASGLMLVGVVASWRSGALPEVVGIVGAGALAGAFALGLDDEAIAMLRSSPTSALIRLGHRVAVLVPAMIAAAVVLVVAERLLFAERTALPSISATSALVTAGVAAEVWWSRRRRESAAEGAAVAVIAWALAPSMLPGWWFVDRLGHLWQRDASWVCVLSVVLAVAGTAGRDA